MQLVKYLAVFPYRAKENLKAGLLDRRDPGVKGSVPNFDTSFFKPQ